jgi:hypothetical protein
LEGGINLFSYVGGNPTRWIDIFGLKPGDAFNSRNEAAIDAIDFYIVDSNKAKKEYGGFIYKNTKANKYYYTRAVEGDCNKSYPEKFNKPPAGKDKDEKNIIEAVYHTHPGTDYNQVTKFSDSDRFFAMPEPMGWGVDVYMGNYWEVKVYSPWKSSTESIIKTFLKH